jgi:hypothetical protein
VGTPQPSHYLKWTAGPDLTGPLSRLNLGIVTQMAFRQIQRPERHYIHWGVAPDAHLKQLVGAVDRLGRQGVINPESVDLGYANCFVQAVPSLTGDPAGGRAPLRREVAGDGPAWNFYKLVSGTARVTDAVLADLREVLALLCGESGALDPDAPAGSSPCLPEFLRPLAQPLEAALDPNGILAPGRYSPLADASAPE